MGETCRRAAVLAIAIALGCGKSSKNGATGSANGSGTDVGSGTGTGTGSDAGQISTAQTPDGFLAGVTPTFVIGTTGDDRADRGIAGQVALIRGLLFPTATVVTDTAAIDHWPEHAVVYGGPHVNALMAKLAPCLPFALSAGSLSIGGQRFDGDDYALVTVVPAHPDGGACPAHPSFLLYAGTGTPGVAEINTPSVARGDQPITIDDAFGLLVGGRYDGGAAVLGTPAPRGTWTRAVTQRSGVSVTIATTPGAQSEAAVAAALRGIDIAVHKLELDGPGLAMTLYIHPDHAAKQAATGNGGDGHAIGFARALHVVGDVAPEGLEHLVAHESTHVLLGQTWGPAGSPLFGEGVAVWVSGRYQGRTLAEWNAMYNRTGKVADLLGPMFLTLKEQDKYPAAGLIVEAIIGAVGLAAVRDHLFGATVMSWDSACKEAGTTPDQLQAAVDALFAR